MTMDRVHGIGFVLAMGMLSAGLWMVHPSAMLIGIGALLLVLLMMARTERKSNGRSDVA